jgi:predicted permease
MVIKKGLCVAAGCPGRVARSATVDGMLRELRYSFQSLRRSPTFALTTLLTLTCAIAVNVGIFATLNAVALRRLPAPNPDELVRLSTSFRTGQEVPFSFPMFRELAARQHVVAPLIASTGDTLLTVKARGNLMPAVVTRVTAGYFEELGAVPTAGRLLLPTDINLDTLKGLPVAIIGYGFWQRQYGADPSVLGTLLEVEGTPFTIVGIAPRGFRGFGRMVEPDVTLPLTAGDGSVSRAFDQAGLLWLRIAGRLRSGATVEQARTQIESVWPSIKADIIPPTHAGAQRENFLSLLIRIESLADGYDPYLKTFVTPLLVLQGLALTVLLIGSVNLASLMLRRTARHERERAIRMSLGARPWQAVRHAIVESTVLGVLSMAFALPLGLWASTAITYVLLPNSGPAPQSFEIGLDVRAFAFTAIVVLTSGLICGWLPAWMSVRRNASLLITQTFQSPLGNNRSLRLLVAAQLCLSVVLVTNGGLLVRSLQRVLTVGLGFDSESLLRVNFTPRPERASMAAPI